MIVNHAIVRVGGSHHGSLVPDMLIVLPFDGIKFWQENDNYVSFENPIDGGFRFGYFVRLVTIEE